MFRLAIAAAFAATVAQAETCEITDMRYARSGDGIRVEGVTSCQTGWLDVVVRDQDGAFLGTDSTVILGHVWRIYIDGIAYPREIAVSYTVTPRL